MAVKGEGIAARAAEGPSMAAETAENAAVVAATSATPDEQAKRAAEAAANFEEEAVCLATSEGT